jgi:hypothetical protein
MFTMITQTELKSKSISDIAFLIKKDWVKVNYAAVPYLEAMTFLNSIRDSYGYDSGTEIVLRFLGNASTYRGENAKMFKAELKARLK